MMYHYVITNYTEGGKKMSNTANDGWHSFMENCLKQNRRQDLEIFFNVFLTVSEKDELSKRFNIILELLKGTKTQREIARDLGVSIANVSRGANVLKTYPQNIKEILQV
jgi:Trp operon repressor